MRKGSIKWLWGAFALFSLPLAACQRGEMSSLLSSEESRLSFEETPFTYNDLAHKDLTPVCPAKGKVPILVVPVEFSDLSAFTETDFASLNAVFKGTKEDGTNDYWESVESYYKKSSFGALELDFSIVDPFVPSLSAAEFVQKADNYGSESMSILKEINQKKLTKDGKTVDIDERFDTDKDGYMDAIWLVYNQTSYTYITQTMHFWAYVTNYAEEEGEGYRYAEFGKYANAGLGFANTPDGKGMDAHTFVHETGHLLGLDDYYDSAEQNNISYTGGLTMMDYNVGDHDSFSKFSLGWIDPRLVDRPMRYSLKPYAETGECLLLPSTSYYGNAFGEYLLLEYYTPTSLFELDASKKYNGRYRMFTEAGLRLYHVDARLAEAYYKSVKATGEYVAGGFADYYSSMKDLPEYRKEESGAYVYEYYPMVAHTNSLKDGRNFDGKPLISLVSSRNIPLHEPRSETRYQAVNRDLFTLEGTKSFSLSSFDRYFENGRFNDGTKRDYSFTILEQGEGSLTLEIAF